MNTDIPHDVLIKKVSTREVMGDKSRLDVSHCSQKMEIFLLKAFAKEAKKVTLSTEIMTSKEFEEMRPVHEHSDWGTSFPLDERPGCILENVTELYLVNSGDKEFVPTKLDHLIALMAVFPNCHYAELPPLELFEIKGKDLSEVPLDDFFRFFRGLELLKKQLKNCDERFHHAVIRSLLQSRTLDDHKLNIIGSRSTVSPAHYLALQANTEGKITPNPELLETLKPKDWQQTAYLLLGSGKFAELTLPLVSDWSKSRSSLGTLDFSNNPLLSDDDLRGFLDKTDSSGTSNALKIKRILLSKCYQLNNDSIHNLLQKTPSIKVLDLHGNPQISDKALHRVPKKHLDKLRLIDLRGTQVSQFRIEQLRQNFPKLRILCDDQARTGEVLLHNREATGKLSLISGVNSALVHKEVFSGIENLKNQITKKELSTNSFDSLIHHLYTGELKGIDETSAFELMELAQELDPLLTTKCRQWLIRTITPENVIRRYYQATDLELTGVADAACRFMDLILHPLYPNRIQDFHDVNTHEMLKILRGKESISLKWLDREEFSIPLHLEVDEEQKDRGTVSANIEEVRSLIPPEYYPKVEESLQGKFQEMSKTGPVHIEPSFWTGKMTLSLKQTPLDALEAMENGDIEADLVFQLPSKGLRPSQEIPCNRFFLSSRSHTFLKLIEGEDTNKPILIKTKHPEAFALIIESLMRGKEVDLSDLSMKQLTDLLNEADVYQVTDLVTSTDGLEEWLENAKKEAEDLSWIDFLNWAKKHNNCPIGLRAIQRLTRLFENGKLKEPWASDPAARSNIYKIVGSQSFKYFQNLWINNTGVPILDYVATPSRWLER